MLSKFDDYPIHQTPEPVARPATSDRNAYDRYWFNGYADDGEFYFGIGMGLYPHRNILDCGFSIVRDGEQHAFHASGRAPREPSDTQVGPFKIEIVEPMRSLRVTIAPNDTGIECDLTFTARTACIEEGRQTLRQNDRVIMDATRFAQFGRWQGEIRYAGKTVPVDSTRVYGTKDRSWGIRPIGEGDVGGAPSSELPQIFFLWAPIHFDNHCTFFSVFENEHGWRWHEDGMIVPAYEVPGEIPDIEDPNADLARPTGYDVRYEPGTRRAESAEIKLGSRSGQNLTIELEPLLTFRMKGIGYQHPEWSHGRWKGELAVEGEWWKVDDIKPMEFENLHIQQVMRATCDGREGIGVMEQLCLGPHAPSGFTEFLDPAK